VKVTSYPLPRAEEFSFTAENLEKAQGYIARYPEGRQASAVLWLLYLAQEQSGNWLPPAAIEYVAKLLEMAPIRVYEVASFYSMFNQRPSGRHLIQVCRTTPCWLRGSDEIVAACLEAAGTSRLGEISADGLFEVKEVECLGAGCNAPMFQVNDREYYEDLTPEKAAEIIAALREGRAPPEGSQNGRLSSEPEGGFTTLTDVPAQPTEEEAAVAAKLAALPADATQEQKADTVGTRPPSLGAPRDGSADDLKQIRGIGPVNEASLNALGIYHYDQIAAWNRAEVRWVGTYLGFPGRVEREDWSGQAKALATGQGG